MAKMLALVKTRPGPDGACVLADEEPRRWLQVGGGPMESLSASAMGESMRRLLEAIDADTEPDHGHHGCCVPVRQSGGRPSGSVRGYYLISLG